MLENFFYEEQQAQKNSDNANENPNSNEIRNVNTNVNVNQDLRSVSSVVTKDNRHGQPPQTPEQSQELNLAITTQGTGYESEHSHSRSVTLTHSPTPNKTSDIEMEQKVKSGSSSGKSKSSKKKKLKKRSTKKMKAATDNTNARVELPPVAFERFDGTPTSKPDTNKKVSNVKYSLPQDILADHSKQFETLVGLKCVFKIKQLLPQLI